MTTENTQPTQNTQPTHDVESAQLRFVLFPEDVVITERVAKFLHVIIGDDEYAHFRYDVALNVLRHWTVGDIDCYIELPPGVTFRDQSAVHIGILWEELNLALVDDWVREDNNLPEHELEPFVDIVARSGVLDATPLS